MVKGCVATVLIHATFDHVYLDSRVKSCKKRGERETHAIIRPATLDLTCSMLHIPNAVLVLSMHPQFNIRKCWTRKKYRLNLVVADLGWVDLDSGCTIVCPFLLCQMGIWQNWLGEMA